MWNNVFRPISTDDYDLRFYDCQSEYVRPGRIRKLLTTSRSALCRIQPLRTHRSRAAAGGSGLQAVGTPVVFACIRACAAGGARHRPDPLSLRRSEPRRRQLGLDPGTRRVRRLSEAILSTATGAQSYDPDHYAGFNPRRAVQLPVPG